MTTAVLGATGAQAWAIADRLSRDREVRRLSRRGGDGLWAVDTASTDDLARAFDGARSVVMTSPLDYRPGVREAYAERVARAAERAGVARLVLNTAAAVPDDSDYAVARDLRAVRAVIQSGAVPSTVVQPTVYLDNLLAPWFLPAILADGVLASPAPEGAAISYISHASLAEFVAAVIDEADAAGRVYDIGGPQPLRGSELAAVVSKAIGRPVRYQELDLDEFAAGINGAFGKPAGDDVADMYRHLGRQPKALSRDGSAWEGLDLRPETADAWADRQIWERLGDGAAGVD